MVQVFLERAEEAARSIITLQGKFPHASLRATTLGKRGISAVSTSGERAWHPDAEAGMGSSVLWAYQSRLSQLNLDVCLQQTSKEACPEFSIPNFHRQGRP